MTLRTFPDAENLVMEWTKSTSVFALCPKMFLGMPKSAPLPVLTLSRVGGAPDSGDAPVDQARISYAAYAENRPQAKAIAVALVNEIESLGYGSPFVGAAGRLQSGIVVMNMWLPEPVTDVPRYIVDAVFPLMSN